MKIQHLLLPVALICGQARAVNPTDTKYPHKDISIDFLYEACSNVGETAQGRIRFFDCESYVYGLLDAYVAVRQRIPADQRACFSSNIPPWQILEEVRPLVMNNEPNTDKINAGLLIIRALKVLYPCK
jgi:hypothetical protein